MCIEKVYTKYSYFRGEGLAASFDGAWQKRGSGRCYNSLTGLLIIYSFKKHMSMITSLFTVVFL